MGIASVYSFTVRTWTSTYKRDFLEFRTGQDIYVTHNISDFELPVNTF